VVVEDESVTLIGWKNSRGRVYKFQYPAIPVKVTPATPHSRSSTKERAGFWRIYTLKRGQETG
jgi:hypothetical protein